MMQNNQLIINSIADDKGKPNLIDFTIAVMCMRYIILISFNFQKHLTVALISSNALCASSKSSPKSLL